MAYYYQFLEDKNKIPEDTIRFYCHGQKLIKLPELPESIRNLDCCNNNLSELPILPKRLELLYCYNNNLIELPELLKYIEKLYCGDNNIKYLSSNNCQIIKKIFWLSILGNPVSNGFNDDKEFRASL